jgi:hypothetical protein
MTRYSGDDAHYGLRVRIGRQTGAASRGMGIARTAQHELEQIDRRLDTRPDLGAMGNQIRPRAEPAAEKNPRSSRRVAGETWRVFHFLTLTTIHAVIVGLLFVSTYRDGAKKMLWRYLGVASTLVLQCASVMAQELPTDTDLKAAYCLGVWNWLLRGPPDPQDQPSDQTKRFLQMGHDQVERLRGYLLPRISHLDPLPLATASRQGNQDIETFLTLGVSCGTTCRQPSDRDRSACLKTCLGDAGEPTKKCNKIDWLPY